MEQLNKSYAVTRGQSPINWWEVIEKLKQIREKIGEDDLADFRYGRNYVGSDERAYYTTYSSKALSWVTCACGNQCSIIPRTSDGQPKDHVLHDLGAEFYGAISTLNIQQATRLLNQIEQRSNDLIIDIQKDAVEREALLSN